MKKIILFVACAFTVGLLKAQHSVVSQAGTLDAICKKNSIDYKSVTSLSLSGSINAKDFIVLRDSMTNLVSLDMSEVSIASYSGVDGPGGTTVSGYNANAIPTKAFTRGNDTLKLTSLVLPKTITDIGESAFWGASQIKVIDIPATVSSIASDAFLGINSDITVAAGNTYFVAENGVLFNTDKTTLVYCSRQKTGTYIVPTSVTTIGDYAFAYSNLSEVFAIDVTSIGESAFFNTINLSEFAVSSSVTELKASTFRSSSIKALSIPSSVTSIGDNFASYSNLESIEIPSSVQSIGIGAFYGCTSLKTAVVKAKILSLPRDMFSSCNHLQQLKLPFGITTIENSVCYNCLNLTKVSIPGSVSYIGSYAFNYIQSGAFYVGNPTPPSLGNYVFSGVNKQLSILYVPKGSKARYQTATQWKDFLRIEELDRPLYEHDTIFLPASGGETKYTLDISQQKWNVAMTTASNWLKIDNVSNETERYILLTATANTSSPRATQVFLEDGEFLFQPIVVSQDTAIGVVKKIADTVINKSDISKKWLCAAFFKYSGKGYLSFSASSNNPAIATAVLHGKGMALVPYSKGEATITITATSSLGSQSSIQFKVTVTDNTVENCSTFSLSANYTPLVCAATSTATANVTATGGSTPYSYKWSTGCSDRVAYNLAAGNYSVVVSDSLGCVAHTVVSIPEVAHIRASVTGIAPNCKTANGTLSVSAIGGDLNYSYKWSSGESSASISQKAAGVYSVTVTDGAGCSVTKTVSLTDTLSPIINIDSVKGARCSKAGGNIYTTAYGGTTPYTYAWSNKATTDDITSLLPGNYTLTVTDGKNCKTIATVVVPAKKFRQPKIALVTVGDTSKKNVVVWLKERTDAISHYNIYREKDRNEFIKVGTVPYNQSSVFVDNTVDPLSQSFRYRISAEDSCKNESLQSREYKTMHAKIRQLDKKVLVSWDDYEGEGVYAFIIERQDVLGNWKGIAIVPASKNRFIDESPLAEKKNYRIAVLFDQILASELKSDTGPFSQSLSNMSEASLVSSEPIMFDEDAVYPNPTADRVHIGCKTDSKIEFAILTDIIGREFTVAIEEQTASEITLSLQGLEKGIYSVQLPQANLKKAIQVFVK